MNLVVSYKYDGWGNCTVNNITGTIGDINPIRYRRYYYDTETGYYYLNSRYYDSNVGRFINADETSNLGVNNDVQSLNLYGYCANNPIHRYDEAGDVWGPAVALGALVGFSSQLVTNVMTGEPWYKNVIGATVGGAVSVAIGGAAGIMISNVINVSLNYMQARVCGYNYSDKDAATDFLTGVVLDSAIGRVTGTLVDSNNNLIIKSSKDIDSKLANNIKFTTKNKFLENSAKEGVDYLSTALDARIRLKADRVVFHMKEGTNKNPKGLRNVFSQKQYSILR